MALRKHKIPATFSLKAGAVDVKADDEGPRKFKMDAYTGAVFDIGFGPAVVDIASLLVSPDGVPALRQHNCELFIGRSAEVDKGPPLRVRGVLFQGIDEADEVASISDQGGRWQASIGIGISFVDDDVSYAEEGASVHVNGRLLDGPFLLLKNTTLKEVSFVPLGADTNTSAVALGDGTISTIDEPVEVTVSTQPSAPSLQDEKKRIADLSTAFSEDPVFTLEAIKKGMSLIDAKLAWGEKLQAELDAQKADYVKKLAELEAGHAIALETAKKVQPASPAAALSGFASGGATLLAADDPADTFEKAVAAECAILRDLGSSGLSRGGGLQLSQAANVRALAVQRVCEKHPELHSAYLEAHNAAVFSRRVR